ncbi:hypothetical protein Q0Z83_100880 [Actinoplanes sichuanensis]|uniref:TetR family transcriptional regulator n=1 Tax=Actinoplanes sichuanensis TaxID=512349 RepID=A0ABW4AFA5_9ACTN|nr:hypothetical protein [Actinoplanes sichuanensis]BEL11897.1 hypothetical protein Q0Z83_100880 [Actinoplanes sichuanensis]
MSSASTWEVPNADHPERRAILAAMTRVLAGTTNRKLTVKDLAEEAGLKRHHLVNKHTDLRDLFYAEVERSGVEREPAVVIRLRKEITELRDTVSKRNETIQELEAKNEQYAENLAVAIMRIRQLERDLAAAAARQSPSDEQQVPPPHGRNHLRSVPTGESGSW